MIRTHLFLDRPILSTVHIGEELVPASSISIEFDASGKAATLVVKIPAILANIELDRHE